MAHFRRKPTPVDALQLRWDTWSEMCELADVGKFADGHPEGCYVDAEGRVTDDSNARIGLRMPYGPVGHVAVEGDWIVRMPDGELVVLKPVAFEALFESHADYEVEYRPRWPRYPHLDVVQEADQELREELKKLLVDARADAVQYVLDVRAEELLRARADERGRIRKGLDCVDPSDEAAAVSVRELTDAQLLLALRNVGCHLDCDACAETFFTGGATHNHTCKERR